MSLSRSRIFLILCLAFLAGVLIAPITPKLITAIAAVIFVTVIAVWWNSKLAKVIGFAGLVLILGVLRFDQVASHNNLQNYYNRNATVSGVVIEEPDVRTDKIYLTLGHLSVNGQQIQDKILVSVYTSHNFYYGDRINFTGKILEPIVFPDFDYKSYLGRFGIDAVMYYPQFDVVGQNQGNKIKSVLLSVKQKFTANLSRVMPEPQNALLAGILVGAKKSIPQDLTDKFNATGTSHIVAISGYNITIIIWALDLFLRRFGKKTASIVSVLVIIGFVVLTGGTASAIRAAIAGVLSLIALNIGRLKNITNGLALTAAAMILWNPKILLYDVGFQLSFLALCGLVYLSPIVPWKWKYVPEWASTALIATLAAQIFTLPILLYNFGILSLVAPLTNVLVLVMVPPAMALGFLVGAIGFVWQALASLIAWPLWVVLSYIIEVVDFTSKIPYAYLSVHIDLWGVVAYYLLLVGGLAYLHFTKPQIFGNLSG